MNDRKGAQANIMNSGVRGRDRTKSVAGFDAKQISLLNADHYPAE